MIKTSFDPVGHILTVQVTGKLTGEDYDVFVPKVGHLISTWGKINVLLIMHDFHGWNMSALWQDLKFDLKHFADIERLAMVGETKWQKGMSAFCRPFTTATIRYFNCSDEKKAKVWAQEDCLHSD